jgi:acyl-CoA synthetase (NDP forming)
VAVNEGLRAMLEARSVAVVGASQRPGTPGSQMVRQLLVGGFAGEAAAVNPTYDEVQGVACYPSLDDVPFVPDLVLLGVGNRLLEGQMVAAAERGARAAVIFASGLEDPPGEPPLTERLRRIAREAGMVICGGNCMGFADIERGLRALAFGERADLEPGGIAWISHSGSAFTALLHAERGVRFNLAVSSGQELTTTMADYMLYALERDSTRVIALFLETVRDPEHFGVALEAAAERDVPVVALKVGRTETSSPLVRAHSGALAGDAAAYEALFDAYEVARVGTLNEMADLLELLGAGRRAAPGGSPRYSTPAASGRTWSTSHPTSAFPSPGRRRRPSGASPRGWSRVFRPSTYWTPGGQATTPTNSFSTAPAISSTIPAPECSRTWWTSTARKPI